MWAARNRVNTGLSPQVPRVGGVNHHDAAATPGSIALSSAPVLARVERSGFVESMHHGLVTVTNPAGEVAAAWGPSDGVVFPRSSNKPLQALAMVRAGLDLPPELLALVCSSHSGEQFHLDGVRAILQRHGLDESSLLNTPDLPYDPIDRNAWIREGREASSLAQNCSGKHAGMLATCTLNGWDLASYREPGHPVQRLMAETLADIAGDEVLATGVDGCGAPVMSLSMTGLARAFGRLASAPEGSDEARVAGALRAAPAFVGGTRRDVSKLIAGVPGLIAKDGAEACYAIGLADGRGVAVKIADGGQRARPVVAAAVLELMGVRAAVIGELAEADVLGHGRPVGAVVAALGEPTEGSISALAQGA